MSTTVAPGGIFGRWTVLKPAADEGGTRRWLCRCACGTERAVPERGLKYGGSTSGGCLRKERVTKALAHDLTGQVFGQLTVLEQSPKRKNGCRWWFCRCECGRLYEVQASLLVTGRRTHCGDSSHKVGHPVDITGQKFGELVALYPLPARSAKGSVLWRCRCTCGNEADYSYNDLVYANLKSCGCRKREHEQQLGTFLTFVDGTSLDLIKSKKLPADNTTGVRGVYLIRGKYTAKIVFQKKAY